jgi:iron complex transport system substrate-binding protein
MERKYIYITAGIIVILLIATFGYLAYSGDFNSKSSPNHTPMPTSTAAPTASPTSSPTASPKPTSTPTSTASPTPTASPSPTATPPPTSKTIVDMAGNTVTVPYTITRISVPYPAVDVDFVMLGVAQYEVAPNLAVNTSFSGIFKQLYPELLTLSDYPYSGATVNTESLLAANPQVVFMYATDSRLSTVESTGIPVVIIKNPSSTQTDLQLINFLGNFFGGNAANQAAAYTSYVNNEIANITLALAGVPISSRPTVLFAESITNGGAEIAGSNTFENSYIQVAGGVNVVGNVTNGNNGYETVDMETVLQYTPQIVLVDSTTGDSTAIYADSNWQGLTAVQNKDVIVNPEGLYNWDGLSPESALEYIWLAKAFYPTIFANVNMVTTMQSFYSQFLNYTMSTTQANSILTAP